VKVYFNDPITQTIGPPPLVGRPTALSFSEIQSLIKQLRMEGWDERAVVTRRVFHPSGNPNMYDMCRPINWGIVIDLRTTAIVVTGQPYLPIKVRWVDDGSISEHWPEELVMIHESMGQWETDQRVKERLE
jgi:hypothetical protein